MKNVSYPLTLFCVGRSSERVFYEKLTKHLFIIWEDDDDEDVEVLIKALTRYILTCNEQIQVIYLDDAFSTQLSRQRQSTTRKKKMMMVKKSCLLKH